MVLASKSVMPCGAAKRDLIMTSASEGQWISEVHIPGCDDTH